MTVKKRLDRLENVFADARSQLATSARVTLLARAFTIEELEALTARFADEPEATTLDNLLTPEEYAVFRAKLAAAQ